MTIPGTDFIDKLSNLAKHHGCRIFIRPHGASLKIQWFADDGAEPNIDHVNKQLDYAPLVSQYTASSIRSNGPFRSGEYFTLDMLAVTFKNGTVTHIECNAEALFGLLYVSE